MNFPGVRCSEISAGAGGVRAYIGAELRKLLPLPVDFSMHYLATCSLTSEPVSRLHVA